MKWVFRLGFHDMSDRWVHIKKVFLSDSKNRYNYQSQGLQSRRSLKGAAVKHVPPAAPFKVYGPDRNSRAQKSPISYYKRTGMKTMPIE